MSKTPPPGAYGLPNSDTSSDMGGVIAAWNMEIEVHEGFSALQDTLARGLPRGEIGTTLDGRLCTLESMAVTYTPVDDAGWIPDVPHTLVRVAVDQGVNAGVMVERRIPVADRFVHVAIPPKDVTIVHTGRGSSRVSFYIEDSAEGSLTLCVSMIEAALQCLPEEYRQQ